MKYLSRNRAIVVAVIASIGLDGCSFLKPSGVSPRAFVLTPMPAAPSSADPSPERTLGLGFVRLPAYLFTKSMAMRRGTNEVVYLETSSWAERLDSGLQRVLAANLATLLPARQVRLSKWRPDQVSAEVYVTVEQFDVDVRGECTLTAGWRVGRPAGGEVLKTGRFQAVRQGTAPDTDPEGAAASMSALAAELSRTLARAIESSAP